MKIKMFLILMALAMSTSAWAVGTCAVTDVTSTQIASTSSRIADAQTVIVTVSCTADASAGTYPSVAIPLTGSYPTSLLNTYNLTGYFLYQVGRSPGTTAPTANYSITITDAQGFALDLGLLTGNGSSTSAQLTVITNATTNYPVVRSALTVAITGNSVNSAGITLTMIFRASGMASSAVGSSTTAASIAGGSAGAQPYQTAESTTKFVYPATDIAMLMLDGNRSDTYTADGTIERPYKTLATLASALPSSGLTSIFVSPNSTYSISSAATLPAVPTTIYGNNSTWTFSAGVTNNAVPSIVYDLNTVGAVTYGTCSSTTRSERHGGSYSGGNVVFGAGCYNHQYGVNLSGNSYTATVNGLLYGEALTGSMGLKSGGSSALIALYNPNMTKSSGYNVDMTSGGQLLMNGGLLSTIAGTANVYLPTANTLATSHAISGLITGTGTGVNCVNGTTTYVVYGFNLAPITNCTLVPGYQGPTTFLGAISAPTGSTGVTQSSGDNSTKLATTAYVDAEGCAYLPANVYTISYNDSALTGVSSATPTKTLFSLTAPSGTTIPGICGIIIQGTTSFTGIANLTVATVRLQSGAGTPLPYSANQDIFGTVGATTNNFLIDYGLQVDRSNQSVVAAFTFSCSSGNCYSSGLTAGSVTIKVGTATR